MKKRDCLYSPACTNKLNHLFVERYDEERSYVFAGYPNVGGRYELSTYEGPDYYASRPLNNFLKYKW